LRYEDEDDARYANRVRAMVAEGLIHPSNLKFTDYLEG
jgi:hypothetical protein